jgi:CheY-like chemotaxis protein
MINDVKIIVIDDDLKNNNPLLILLREEYTTENVYLFAESKEGLDFVIHNLSRKMIVILDLGFGNGQMQGIDVFDEIRNKTSLVYVIIRTAQDLSKVSNADLQKMINNDAMALVDRTEGYKKVLEYVAKAAHQLETRVDSVIERWITRHSDEEREQPYMATRSGKRYSLNDVLQEIRHQTEFGKDMEKKILYLTIDLLTREKEAIDD